MLRGLRAPMLAGQTLGLGADARLHGDHPLQGLLDHILVEALGVGGLEQTHPV